MRVPILLVAMLVGCEGGKGGGKTVSMMSDAELIELCNTARQAFPIREITCEGMMVTVGITADTCATPDGFLVREGCMALRNEVLDCVDAFDALSEAQFCALVSGGSVPPGCPDTVVACFGN